MKERNDIRVLLSKSFPLLPLHVVLLFSMYTKWIGNHLVKPSPILYPPYVLYSYNSSEYFSAGGENNGKIEIVPEVLLWLG